MRVVSWCLLLWQLQSAWAICWDTGCQLDSWAVRGCQQYGMLETGQKACSNGIIFSCCDQNQSTAPSLTSRPKCWDTGCQLDSWAIRGCQQYGMVETGQKSCPNGVIYSCCEPDHTSTSIRRPKCWDTGCQLDSWAVRGCQQYGMVETGQKSCPDGIVYSCCEVNTAPAANISSKIGPTLDTPVKPKCWETGCQLDSWLVRGCDQYGMVEVGQNWCDGGLVYSCCDTNATKPATQTTKPKCWKTGCQLDSWAVRGCEQYHMVEVGQQPCNQGIVYSCCEKNETTAPVGTSTLTESKPNATPAVIIVTPSTPAAKPKCWYTGCQLNTWVVRGCEQYDMIETGQRPCENGIIYWCCQKNSSSMASLTAPATLAAPSKPKCWDTGCQLDAWAIRGCEQYDMIQTGQRPCEGGIIYSCCEKNSSSMASSTATASSVSSTKPKCWDTGCQLDAWAIRGCEQYDMIQTGQRPCEGGIIYSCCQKNSSSMASSAAPATFAAPSKPKCWDTGCQLDAWAIRGCEQYDMIQTGQRPCEGGIIYSCCQKNSSSMASSTATVSSVSSTKPKCWDTGCQLDAWAIRGCEQYDMIQTGQRPCEGGIIYSCCQKNSSSMASSTATASSVSSTKPKCWDTGCQLDAWVVRGCEPYGMVETGQKQCPNGIVYSCCENNSTSGAAKLKPKCWDTGCQLDSWAVRGCEQYNMLEVDQKSCPGGIVYSCCAKNVTTAAPPKLQPKCWDTGCQLDSWAVRGCKQYDMEEAGQKPCDNGIVYSCCHKNGTAPAVRQALKKCWDTGCQLDVWKSRGCAQYGMTEKSQRACVNGIVFTCCRP